MPVILLVGSYTNSQDLIIFNDQSEKKVKVVEVDESFVQYRIGNTEAGITRIAKHEVFMIIYEGGRREIFANSVTPPPAIINSNYVFENDGKTLESDGFNLRLINVEDESDRKAKIARASIEVHFNGAHFAVLSAYIYQRIDKSIDFSNPNRKLWNKSRIVISSKTKNIANILYQKYESEFGRGYGWAMPPGFLSNTSNACQVAFLDQKFSNKEMLGFGGISSGKLKLKNCQSVDMRILSVALIWIDANFRPALK